MKAPRIITTFVYPPIPIRTEDWQAHYDGDEPVDDGQGMAVGHGATEAEAISDLVENYPREEEPSPENFEETFGCPGCICQMSPVHSASMDPPEPVRNRHCPHHGTFDPDAALEARRDDAMERGR